MANHYYGITVPGAKIGDVTVNTSTTGKNVELVVLDGVAGMSKLVLIKALEALADYITENNAPA